MKFFSARFPVFAVLFSAFFAGAGAARAASPGTTAANFLKIPMAPIPAGMGNAYTALSSVDSILFNPAGLGLMNYSSFSGAHNEYFVGIRQEYAALAVRTGLGTMGAAFSILNSGDMEAFDDQEARIGVTSSRHEVAVFSFSQSFPHFNQDRDKVDPMLIAPNWSRMETVTEYRPKTARVSVGVSAKYISESLDDAQSSAFSYDAGALLVLPHHMQLGVSALNISGNQQFADEAAALPLTLRAGAAKDFVTKSRIMIFKLAADGVFEKDMDAYACAGLEVGLMDLVQLRLGYRTRQDIGSGISVGVGFTLDQFADQGAFLSGMRLDYALVTYGDLGATHRMGLQILFR